MYSYVRDKHIALYSTVFKCSNIPTFIRRWVKLPALHAARIDHMGPTLKALNTLYVLSIAARGMAKQ